MAKGGATYRIKWNKDGFDELRNLNYTQGTCKKALEAGFAATGTSKGADFEIDVQEGKHRCHAMAKTVSYTGMRINHQDNTLLKALAATGLPRGKEFNNDK